MGVGHIGRTGDCCSGLSIAVLLQALPRPHAPVSTWFLALFLVTMNWVLAWLEASLSPSFSLKSCQLCSLISSFANFSLGLLLDPSLLDVGKVSYPLGTRACSKLAWIPDTNCNGHQLSAPPRLCPLTAAHYGSSLMLTTRSQQRAYGQTSFLYPTPTSGQHCTLHTHHPLVATQRLAGHVCGPVVTSYF